MRSPVPQRLPLLHGNLLPQMAREMKPARLGLQGIVPCLLLEELGCDSTGSAALRCNRWRSFLVIIHRKAERKF